MRKNLANLVWNGRTRQDVDAILSLVQEDAEVAWRAVGDRPNNIGTIGMASEPGLAVVERITNMFDALLELGRALNPEVEVRSPRHAAAQFYGVPSEGLHTQETSAWRRLAERMVVSLEESGNPKRPSVVIQDEGIGETARRFPTTLLSLNESNKVDKPWTMGTYGQGGSVTFGFCEATIVVSRRHPSLLDGEADRVAWTIVMKRYDPSKKLPNYEYLVAADGQVMSFDPSLIPDFDHGTRVIHVEYDLQISGPFTTNPYQFFNAALFEPVLPYVLTGNRGKESSYSSRVMIGNAARLQNVERARGEIEVAHTDAIKLDLGQDNGWAEARYWVLRRPADSSSRSDPTGGYVQAREAICITLHGQRQDVEERFWLRRNAALSFLFKNMIVQIDATYLTGKAKAEIFASTRERGRSSEIRSKLYEALAFTLRHDPDLKYLNHEEKERVLQRSTAATNERIRRRLGKFIKTKLKELSKAGKGQIGGAKSAPGAGRVGTKHKPGKPTPPRDTSDDHLLNDPTHLRFRRADVSLRRGERAHLVVELNAKNGYLPENDEFLEVRIEGQDPSAVRVTSRSALMGGQCRWVLEADEHAELGAYRLTASLVCPSGVLEDSADIQVRGARKAGAKNEPGREAETGPEVRWVFRDQWEEHGWGPNTVGEVHDDDESTTILVNRHYAELDRALKGKTLTAAQVETRADRYQYPVACGLWLQNYFVNQMEDTRRPSEAYRDAELRRMADAVLVAVDPDVDLAKEEGDVAA